MSTPPTNSVKSTKMQPMGLTDPDLLPYIMRIRIERDNLWILHHNTTPVHRDLWSIVVSYYTEDPRIADLLDDGVKLNLSDGFAFILPPQFEFCYSSPDEDIFDGETSRDDPHKLDLYHTLFLLPDLLEIGTEEENTSSHYSAYLIDSEHPDDTRCLNIEKYVTQIRDILYKKLYATKA